MFRLASLARVAPAVAVLGLALVGTSPATAQHATPAPSASAPASAKPTVVLVHGAWADTSSWSGEVRILRQQGYPVRAIGNPVENLTTDAESVADFLRTIPGPVVLVGHSYGGSVITNAAAEVSNVKALVYVDAAAPAVGETNGSLSGATSALNAPADTLFDQVGATDLYLKENIFLHNFAQDLPSAQATDLWASQRAASTAAFDTPSRYAAWQSIPSWYFISTGDEIITPQSELMMAHRARSTITVFPGGSHLTLVSHPGAVVQVIDSAVRAVR